MQHLGLEKFRFGKIKIKVKILSTHNFISGLSVEILLEISCVC